MFISSGTVIKIQETQENGIKSATNEDFKLSSICFLENQERNQSSHDWFHNNNTESIKKEDVIVKIITVIICFIDKF